MVEGELRLDRRALLSGVAMGAAALSGCGAIAGGSSTSELRFGTIQPPMTLDPFRATDVGSHQAIARVFDGLYTYGEETDVVPQLAAGAPAVADDGREVTVELDERARFHNGEPVRASDVAYTYEAPERENAPSKWRVTPFERVEAVDDRTVRFRLAEPSPALAHLLAFPVVPEAVREADRETFARDPVGAGPYRVESFSEEKKTVLTSWEEYWGEPAPEIDRFTFAYVESPITQLMGLVTGRSDLIAPVSPRYREDVTTITDAQVAERTGFRSFYYGFNCNDGPTSERIVREAIARCIDLQKLVDQFVAPVGERQYSLLPESVAEEWDLPVEEWAEAVPPKDVEQARAKFEAAPVSIGQLTILTSKHPVWKELAFALASGLRDAGQSALVKAVKTKKYLERYVSGSAEDYAVFVGEVAGDGDPDSFLYPTVHENAQGHTNGVFYNEEEPMNHLLAARQTTDRQRRRERYEAAISRIHEDRPYVPICSFANSFAHRPGVEGLRVHPIAQLNPRLTSPDGAVSLEGR